MRACLAAAVLGSLLGLWISPGRGYAAELEPTRELLRRLHERSRPVIALRFIQGEARGPRCCCDDSDVYDGYAECAVHPQGEVDRTDQRRPPART